MSLFKKQIETLIVTLGNIPEPKSFDMETWYGSEAENSCGYAACICGHQALAPYSKYFPSVKDSGDYAEDAGDVAVNLIYACEDLTGNAFLASSIYNGEGSMRQGYAKDSLVFTEVELKHPHLTKENPTPEDAISYLRLVLEKLEKHNG